MLWEKWGLNGDLTLTDHDMRYWINMNTEMKFFGSDIYYFIFWLCQSKLLHFFTKIIWITPWLLLYQDYFQTTLSFVNQTITIFRLLYTEYGDYFHALLLSFIDYSETTPIISFWKQVPFLNYPQTAPLLRFIPYYSYFQVNKTTQSQNIKATPTLLINFKHSKAILSDNSHCQIT